jgi:hypothetical protein
MFMKAKNMDIFMVVEIVFIVAGVTFYFSNYFLCLALHLGLICAQDSKNAMLFPELSH